MASPIPIKIKVAAAIAAGLMGPAVVFSFLLGGPMAGIGVLLAFVFFFLILYMYVVRQYGG
jgi:hypothetical protein